MRWCTVRLNSLIIGGDVEIAFIACIYSMFFLILRISSGLQELLDSALENYPRSRFQVKSC
jgi:hypothetical protein